MAHITKLRILALTILFALFSGEARAITIDGNASDWFGNSTSGYGNWAPTAEVTKYVNHNGVYTTIPQTANWDNRAYDIEMGAFSAQDTGLFLMIVLSDADVWEDLAIAVNGSDKHQYGVDLTNLDDKKGKVQNRNVYEVTQWDTTHAGFSNLPDFDILKGTVLGQSQFIFSKLPTGDDKAKDYLVEGFISWSLLGGRPESICLQFSEISCLRDSMNLCGATGGGSEVPEPATMMLLGTGLLGAVVRKRRSKTVE